MPSRGPNAGSNAVAFRPLVGPAAPVPERDHKMAAHVVAPSEFWMGRTAAEMKGYLQDLKLATQGNKSVLAARLIAAGANAEGKVNPIIPPPADGGGNGAARPAAGGDHKLPGPANNADRPPVSDTILAKRKLLSEVALSEEELNLLTPQDQSSLLLQVMSKRLKSSPGSGAASLPSAVGSDASEHADFFSANSEMRKYESVYDLKLLKAATSGQYVDLAKFLPPVPASLFSTAAATMNNDPATAPAVHRFSVRCQSISAAAFYGFGIFVSDFRHSCFRHRFRRSHHRFDPIQSSQRFSFQTATNHCD